MCNHTFDVDIATEYKSIDVAILVGHFQYWIRKNKALGINLREERTWTFQTYNQILANFPYWSYHQLKRLLKKCFALGIIIKGNFNIDKDDVTTWYAFKDEEKFGISKIEKRQDLNDDSSGIGRNRPMDRAKSPYRSGEIALSYKDRDTIPDTKEDKDRKATPSPSVSSSRMKAKEVKREVADRVWVTDTQEKALLKKIGDDPQKLQKIYARLSDWKIGKNIIGGKNDYGAITQWVIDAVSQDENVSTFQEDKIKEDKNLAIKIWNKFKGRSQQDISLSAKYLEFINGVNAPSTIIEFGKKDFIIRCLEELKKRNLKLENI